MARLNGILKFTLINVNILFSVIGLFILALGVYLLAGNFGKLDPGFFLGTGLIIVFCGTTIVVGSCLGCQGAINQTEKFGKIMTGRKIIGVYQILIVTSLAIELYMLSVCLRAAGEYAEVYPILQRGEAYPEYVSLEKAIELKFNAIYFSAQTTCEVTVFNQFWDWVGNHCPETLSMDNCQGCFDYSVTFCQADEATCYSTSEGDGATCPYTICRAGVLEYLSYRITPVSYGILALCLFQGVVAVINMMLMCYTPRDDLEKILIKSGTLAAAKNNN